MRIVSGITVYSDSTNEDLGIEGDDIDYRISFDADRVCSVRETMLLKDRRRKCVVITFVDGTEEVMVGKYEEWIKTIFGI